MKKLKLILLFSAGLIVGVSAASWRFYQFTSQMAVAEGPELAFRAAEEANWLAQLRMNETNSVIEQLETSIDSAVSALSSWDELKQPDVKTRKMRDRFLISVKIYREIYPPVGEDADQIKSFLATIPGRDPQTACDSGVCRLDDLHRARENAKAVVLRSE